MKLVNFIKNGKPALGIATERGLADISEVPGAPHTLGDALALGLEGALAALKDASARAERHLPLDGIEYAPAADDPEKILCVGKNYRDHVSEVPELFPTDGTSPEIFVKFRSSLTPHNGTVRLNPNSRKHDYEAEIAVIIGKTAFGLTPEEAMDCVFGYTLANDVTARDLQKDASQWTPGKACDTFCPLGPWIVTADEAGWDELSFAGYKNGELRQEGRARDMIRSVPQLVSFLSGCMTLRPGDVILTGTPSGVIFGRPADRQDWLKAGDVLEIRSEQLGVLTVTVTE